MELLELLPIAAFSDNYIWMLHDGHQALVVDPGDATPVLAALEALSLRLTGILVTHHHSDHVGGLAELRPHLDGPIFGPRRENIPNPYTAVDAGTSVELLGQRFDIIDIPGHTSGHIAFYCAAPSDDSAPILFCGDTLFSGGCGRLFEGTPAQMHASLQTLAELPSNSRVCCAHEYTLSNLRFARRIEPANAELAAYEAWCQSQRTDDLPTLPSSLATERQINPFLRASEPAVVAAALAHAPSSHADPVSVFATLRQWKNDFR